MTEDAKSVKGKGGKNTEEARAARRAERQARNKAEREAQRAEKQQERARLRDAGKAEKQKKRSDGEDKPPAGDAAQGDISGKGKAGNKGKAKEKGKGKPTSPAIPPSPASQPATDSDGGASAEKPTPERVTTDEAERRAFNILIVAQRGRLEKEAVIFAASLRRHAPDWSGQLIVAEPQPEGAWQGGSTRIQGPARAALESLGAQITPFTAHHFGRAYPYGNKIEALGLLPQDQPFIFFDSDTLVIDALDRLAIDFDRPTASMAREGSWPEPPLYGPGYTVIWRSLYDRFGLDFDSSLDLSQPDEHWERYLYFNAGWFLGADPKLFGERFLEYALAVRNDPGDALASQSLDPWLDQAVLPLVIHSLNGGRPGPQLDGLDGNMTCHYRNLSLLYARGSERAIDAFEDIAAMPEIADLMQGDPAYEALYRQGIGRERVRALFEGRPMPSREQAVRQMLRKEKLWFGR